MKIKNTYPADQKVFSRSRMTKILRWPFLAAAFACIVVNVCVGGKAWSAVVCWGLYGAWNNVIALDMVGYNRLEQSVKGFMQLCVLLLLIDVCLAPGKLQLVFPILAFSVLIVLAALFFSDLRRQKRNVMPMLLLSLGLLILCTVGAWIWDAWHWTVIVLASVSFTLTMVCIAVLGEALVKEARKYFHLR